MSEVAEVAAPVEAKKPKASPKLLVTMAQMEKKLLAHSADDQNTILNYLRSQSTQAFAPANALVGH